jgi:hypothetical protein
MRMYGSHGCRKGLRADSIKQPIDYGAKLKTDYIQTRTAN